jgi:hypothetical protein
VARPTTPAEICQLIRQMSVANPLWGAPRIHGELLNLGWNAFLRNHVIRSFGDVRSMSGLRETGRAEPLRPGSSLASVLANRKPQSRIRYMVWFGSPANMP